MHPACPNNSKSLDQTFFFAASHWFTFHNSQVTNMLGLKNPPIESLRQLEFPLELHYDAQNVLGLWKSFSHLLHVTLARCLGSLRCALSLELEPCWVRGRSASNWETCCGGTPMRHPKTACFWPCLGTSFLLNLAAASCHFILFLVGGLRCNVSRLLPMCSSW